MASKLHIQHTEFNIDRTKDTIYVFTDGSNNNHNGGSAGGFGIVLIYKDHEQHYSFGRFDGSTSARMEIRAVLQSLKLITNKELPVVIHSDNEYVCKSVMEKWVYKWESQEWVSGIELRKNHDLWQEMLVELRKFKQEPLLKWVRGHSGIHYNEICDRLAAEGGKKETVIIDRK